MGLFNSSKSSSATITTNTATTASDGSVSLAAGSAYNVTDGGATQAAIDAARDMVKQSQDTTKALFSAAVQAAQQSADAQAQLSLKVSTSAQDLAKNAQSADGGQSERITKAVLWSAVGVAALAFISRGRSK